MQLNLDELKSNFPTPTLNALLQRSQRQISSDLAAFKIALQCDDFARAAQLLHRTRGLALLLGVSVADLVALRTGEDCLLSQAVAVAAGYEIDMSQLITQFEQVSTQLTELLQQARDS